MCSKIFCRDHFRYESHSCPNSYQKDIQVPICPLCDKPVAVKRGQLPDIRVGQHIDLDCESDPAIKKRNAIYKNKCSVKGCKQKELMPLLCDGCGLNHCLKHRHFSDHNCKPSPNSKVSKSGSAALQRLNQNKNSSALNPHSDRLRSSSPRNRSNNRDVYAVQGNYSEDEALARALQQSLIETNKNSNESSSLAQKPSTQEQEDRNLAEAIAQSQRVLNRNKDKCNIS